MDKKLGSFTKWISFPKSVFILGTSTSILVSGTGSSSGLSSYLLTSFSFPSSLSFSSSESDPITALLLLLPSSSSYLATSSPSESITFFFAALSDSSSEETERSSPNKSSAPTSSVGEAEPSLTFLFESESTLSPLSPLSCLFLLLSLSESELFLGDLDFEGDLLLLLDLDPDLDFEGDLLLLLDLDPDLDLAGDPDPDLDLDGLFDFPDLEPLPDLDLAEPDRDLGVPDLDFGDPDLDLLDPDEPDLADLDLDLLESDPESFSLSPSKYLSLLLLPILSLKDFSCRSESSNISL